ncbi:MAG: DMT family transporter [Actinobacteria bacterium]|nr:DMT family transporter [Actinomycetota bacterium]MCL6104964.1 DMT family transporter [Actinomycetota bacterium]
MGCNSTNCVKFATKYRRFVVGSTLIILAALGAAVCYGVADPLQRREVLSIDAREWQGTAAVRAVFKNKIWLIATTAEILGTGLELLALRRGNLIVVSFLLATSLIMALILDMFFTRAIISFLGWIMVFCVVGGTTVLVITMGNAPGGSPNNIPLGIATVVVVLFVAVLNFRVKKSTPVLLAIGAAFALGMAVPLAKATVQVPMTHFSVFHILLLVFERWEFYFAVGLSLAGLWLMQHAYRLGPLAASLPIVTIGQPLVSIAIGVTCFGEQLPSSSLKLAVIVASLTVIVFGLVILSAVIEPDVIR